MRQDELVALNNEPGPSTRTHEAVAAAADERLAATAAATNDIVVDTRAALELLDGLPFTSFHYLARLACHVHQSSEANATVRSPSSQALGSLQSMHTFHSRIGL